MPASVFSQKADAVQLPGAIMPMPVMTTLRPSGFTTLRPMLYRLSRLKKKWKINIIDDKPTNEYVVKFEDKFNVRVPKTLWEEFTGKILRCRAAMGVPGILKISCRTL